MVRKENEPLIAKRTRFSKIQLQNNDGIDSDLDRKRRLNEPNNPVHYG